MDNSVKEKLLVASIARLISDRDKTVFEISAILGSDYKESVDYVGALTSLFKELSQQELAIESLQVYYARHFKQPEIKTPENDNTP